MLSDYIISSDGEDNQPAMEDPEDWWQLVDGYTNKVMVSRVLSGKLLGAARLELLNVMYIPNLHA